MLPSRSSDFLITPICQPFSLWFLGLPLAAEGPPHCRLVKMRRACQLRARDGQIQRGGTNRIDRMPRKIAPSPVRNLPTPHLPCTVLFQPVVVCYAVDGPDFPLSLPPFSFLHGEGLVCCFCRLFSAILGAAFTCRSPAVGLSATLDDIFIFLSSQCPPPLPGASERGSQKQTFDTCALGWLRSSGKV